MNNFKKLKDTISKINNEKVLEILKCYDLNLDNDDLIILKKTKISGKSLIIFKQENFRDEGLAASPTLVIMGFIKKLKKGI
jgi:hypothetical protein